MAFNDTYRESIQSKHIANVGFTSTAKGVTNEAFALENPHQIIASQIPAVDVVGTYGALVADGINAGLVEKHTVKLTADPTVNNNLAWYAVESNCTTSGHSTRGSLRLTKWMRYAGTQYKLRLYQDTGSNAPNYSAEILPSEVNFNWEYDASTGVVYFDEDPSANGKTLPLWGELYTYIGNSVEDSLNTTTSGLAAHTHVEADITDLDKYTQAEVDALISSTSGTLQSEINTKSDVGHNHDSSYDALGAASSAVSGHELAWDHDSFATHTEVSTVSGVLQEQIDNLNLDFATDAELAAVSGTLQNQIDALDDTYATDAELAAVSGTLQGAIDQNTTDISNLDDELTTASGYLQSQIDALDDTYATDAELSAVSGTLQNQIDNLDDTYATDAELASVSGSLQNQITENYNTLDSKINTASGTLQSEIDALDLKIDTTSGTLQSEIEALDASLTDAIIWEVVDTPYEQIRPKAAHMGKAIYTSGNLTIGGDLTVSGTTTTINSQELTVTDKMITVNNGEVGAGITGEQYAGIQVDRGSEADYFFVFDEAQDNFRVGISGSLQAVATREDSPTDGYVAVWNASEYRFDTSTSIALDDLATDAELSAVSGTLQGAIDAVALDLSTNYYTKTELDNGQLDNRYYTETELDGGQLDNRYYTETEIDLLVSTTSGTLQSQIDILDTKIDTASGTLQSQINNIDLDIIALDSKIDTTSGTLQSEIDALDIKIDTTSGTLQSDINAVALDLSTNYYTSVEVDNIISTTSGTLQSEIDTLDAKIDTASGTLQGEINDLSNAFTGHTHSEADITDLDKYTQSEVNNLLAAQDEFIELHDTMASYTDKRVLFTTASGVTDNAVFTFDSVSGTLNVTGIQLGTGGVVNEIVTTVTSGTTNSQLPTAKAVWDLTQAAAAAVHIHHDVDATHVSDTSWTYGSGFASVPSNLTVYVNGMKNRVGSDNDYTVAVPGGVLTITFLYSVKSDFWVNITYTV